MKHQLAEKPRRYESPTIEDLGSLRDLTAGSKDHSLADFHSGQTNGGPGS